MARPDMTPDLGNEFWIRTQLLAGCSGTLVKVFDPLSAGTASGIAQVPFEEGARANAVQWTHNNKALVFAGQRGTVALYSSGRYLGGIPNETSVSLMREITALRLSSDSLKLVAGCSDGAMHVWDTRVQVLMPIEPPVLAITQPCLEFHTALMTRLPRLFAFKLSSGEVYLPRLPLRALQERVHLIDDHKSAIASIAVCPSEAGDIVASSRCVQQQVLKPVAHSLALRPAHLATDLSQAIDATHM